MVFTLNSVSQKHTAKLNNFKMSIYERMRDGQMTHVLRAKLYSQITEFAVSGNIQVSIAEVNKFLTEVDKIKDEILFINLNAPKQKGGCLRGGSINVHYAQSFTENLKIRMIHSILGKHNEYFGDDEPQVQLNLLYPVNKRKETQQIWEKLFEFGSLIREGEFAPQPPADFEITPSVIQNTKRLESELLGAGLK